MANTLKIQTIGKVGLGGTPNPNTKLNVAPPTRAIPVDVGFLNNQIGWMTNTLQVIARTLEQPADQTMKDLPAYTEAIMKELKSLRSKNKK